MVRFLAENEHTILNESYRREAPDVVNFDNIAQFPIDGEKLTKLLGGKGFSLVEMKSYGLPVPPGFILTTRHWQNRRETQSSLTVNDKIMLELKLLEALTGQKLGAPDNPLILAVRSSPVDSMPGAMNTVTNVGINDYTVVGLSRRIGTKSALRSYYQLIKEIGEGIGTAEEDFNELQNHMGKGKTLEEFTDEEMKLLIDGAKLIFQEKTNNRFPEEPDEQLSLAISNIFVSYNNKKAQTVRANHSLPYESGTGCIIMPMIFGNVEGGGAGFGFNRNPYTFEEEPMFIFRANAQGRDVVNDKNNPPSRIEDLTSDMRIQMQKVLKLMEVDNSRHKLWDFEFVYDKEKLWIVQRREAPISNLARVRQMLANEYSARELSKVLAPQDIDALLEPGLDPEAVQEAIAQKRLIGSFPGTRIAPGISCGIIVHDIKQLSQKSDHQKIIYAGHLTLDNIHVLSENMDIVGVLSPLGSFGSHSARYAEKYALINHAPVAFGIPQDKIEAIADGTLVTVDASTPDVRIFLGQIQRGEKSAFTLTQEETDLLRVVKNLSRQNEWMRLADESTVEQYRSIVEQALKEAQSQFTSIKAIQEYVKNSVLPPDICEEYIVMKPESQNEIKNKLLENVRKGNDVSIRTCCNPDARGISEYRIFSSDEDIESFFAKGLFGILTARKEESNVTEVLVGAYPKGKLDKDKQDIHASWTLSINDGILSLVISPHSAKLRVLGEANTDEVITRKEGPIRSYYSENDPPFVVNEYIPTKYTNDLKALQFYKQIQEEISLWISQFDLTSRLAALAEVFKYPTFSTPTLEGQAKVGSWTKVYGLNIDSINNNH